MALIEVQLTGMAPEVRNQNTVLVQFEAKVDTSIYGTIRLTVKAVMAAQRFF